MYHFSVPSTSKSQKKNQGIVISSSRIFSAVVSFDMSFLTPRVVNE